MPDEQTSFTPEQGSIVLGPGPLPDGEWILSFSDQAGDDIEICLPERQLEEMDAEFTGEVGDG